MSHNIATLNALQRLINTYLEEQGHLYQASLTEVPDDEPYTPQMTVRESVRLSLVAHPVRSSGLEEKK